MSRNEIYVIIIRNKFDTLKIILNFVVYVVISAFLFLFCLLGGSFFSVLLFVFSFKELILTFGDFLFMYLVSILLFSKFYYFLLSVSISLWWSFSICLSYGFKIVSCFLINDSIVMNFITQVLVCPMYSGYLFLCSLFFLWGRVTPSKALIWPIDCLKKMQRLLWKSLYHKTIT